MKKALVIFLALALVGSVFADEPAAEVKVAEFKGDAAVTFGLNLDDGHTGFKNETSGSLKLNLLNGGDKSTTGDGVWGELKIKFDGITVEAKNDKASALNDKKVSIETAKIHFGPVYMGILEGDFDFGGDFYYPNALNYKDKDDHKAKSLFVRNPLPELGYNQGVVIGYEHDMFSVEASLRSKKDTPKKFDKVELVILEKDTKIKKEEYYDDGAKAFTGGAAGDIFNDTTKVDAVAGDPTLKKVKDNMMAFKRVMKDDESNYWTNKFAMGVYGEVKPVKDLRVGVGFAYAMGELGLDTKEIDKDTKNEDNTKDMDLFVGADYRFNINDSFFLQPTLTYSMYNNYVWTKSDEGKYHANHLTAFGLRFGFAKSKSSDGNSLLYDFFGKNTLYYDKHAEDKGDDMLLPGVSVFSYFIGGDLIRTNLPVMVTFYSGELVKGLNVSALYGVNVGKDATSIKGTHAYFTDDGRWKVMLNGAMQAGIAASYDVKVGDITIVPAVAFLWKHSMLKGDDSSKTTVDRFQPEFKVDVKGLVDNTTFSLFWDEAKFGNITAHAYKVGSVENKKVTRYENTNGVFGVKAKISF